MYIGKTCMFLVSWLTVWASLERIGASSASLTRMDLVLPSSPITTLHQSDTSHVGTCIYNVHYIHDCICMHTCTCKSNNRTGTCAGAFRLHCAVKLLLPLLLLVSFAHLNLHLCMHSHASPINASTNTNLLVFLIPLVFSGSQLSAHLLEGLLLVLSCHSQSLQFTI